MFKWVLKWLPDKREKARIEALRAETEHARICALRENTQTTKENTAAARRLTEALKDLPPIL